MDVTKPYKFIGFGACGGPWWLPPQGPLHPSGVSQPPLTGLPSSRSGAGAARPCSRDVECPIGLQNPPFAVKRVFTFFFR